MRFYIPGVYYKSQHTSYSTIRVVRASFPDSYYKVSSPYNVLNVVSSSGENKTFVLPEGDYEPKEFANLVSSYLIESTNNIVNNKYIFTSTQYFEFGIKTTCNQHIGMNEKSILKSKPNTDSNGTTIYYISMPNVFQFDYPYSYFIHSDSSLNYNLNTKTNTRYFWEVIIDNANSTTQYINTTNSIQPIQPSNNFDNVIIEIKDINGNYINFNGAYWTIAIEISECLNYYDYGDTNPSLTTNNVALLPNFYGNEVGFEGKRRRLK
ncbi:hypothetical protein EBZ38_06755 [bacterium]|nr:hypothetical protein [bacterium]NDD83962.1 hypothetical protein [bacterium]